jgi:hypothetical protein
MIHVFDLLNDFVSLCSFGAFPSTFEWMIMEELEQNPNLNLNQRLKDYHGWLPVDSQRLMRYQQKHASV